MRVHYLHPDYGMTCNTNRTRATSHRVRTSRNPNDVTCATCRKQHNLGTELGNRVSADAELRAALGMSDDSAR